MAQAEDTELRDLVIEALERNGSLAKIRALLRANIFLAFEDEYDNRKQNINLDNILKLPEGILALSVVHEFLEFCCLKNTLFVYMSESRQGSEYNYDGQKSISDKLNILKSDNLKEPILLTIIKNVLKLNNKSFDKNLKGHDRSDDKNYGDDQNCTYILHEDSQSSTNSNTNSDNSSDEKNKLQLRLQLDNSDTDTSSEFARDKSSSEYIPGDHILESNNITHNINNANSQKPQTNIINSLRSDKELSVLNSELKLPNSSSDSTSYIDLIPFNSLDEKMLNTAGLPVVESNMKNMVISPVQPKINIHNDLSSPKYAPLNSLSWIGNNKIKDVENYDKKLPDSTKSDGEAGDFSYGDDFSSSTTSKFKDISEVLEEIADNQKGDLKQTPIIISPKESPHQTSPSSVSLSDVIDLISEKSLLSNINKTTPSVSISKDKVDDKSNKLYSDDSGDFTESPVPSLSNLSLDIHSD